MPASSFWNVWSKNFQSADQFLSRLGPFVSKNQHFERWWEISTRMRMVSTQRTDLKFQWLVPVQQWIAENNHWPLWVDFYDFDFLWSYFDLRLSLGSSKGMPPAPLPSHPTHEKNVKFQKKTFLIFFWWGWGVWGEGISNRKPAMRWKSKIHTNLVLQSSDFGVPAFSTYQFSFNWTVVWAELCSLHAFGCLFGRLKVDCEVSE